MTDIGVEPYREITFDADGDADPAERAALTGVDATDLVLFAHGWNNTPTTARSLYRAFFAAFPPLLAGSPGVRLAYGGVTWPSIRFTDETIPDFPHATADPPAPGPGLDPATVSALKGFFPGQDAALDTIASYLREQPDSEAAFTDFGRLTRNLVTATGPAGPGGDLALENAPGVAPALLTDSAVELCRRFTAALAETGMAVRPGPPGPSFSIGGSLKHLWNGAKEVLRQTTYYEMKHRAGTVGQNGLGPLIGQLARVRPELRVHVVGHSQGARLVAFALKGLPQGARNLKSVTLLEGAFSHYVFAERLPDGLTGAGALSDAQARLDGPVVSCYSHFDTALGVIYPLASALSGDYASALPGLDRRWWAIGHDGIQAVSPCTTLTLAEALRDGVPDSGCVSVDAAAVVKSGGPPTGAHSDICHPELARVVLAAGRIVTI
ncbi:serine-threonine protein kinase [Streptomyces sp. NBC_00083]|uniref:serine-threonine protein kinase n=1 Tax=Streptomyces sp. NBC_00083 TaxID=2975647 RepID=UPI0022586098|nr:serine-threonine protein kinase [Streptomyces sp. NBC_00083]MCX5383370.1 serine-threonine protein kinase [Streptomyces sp. NBC_00083]